MELERRRRVIEESKYLGGDMAHTHLVKGLDYALLEKVRSEIAIKSTHEASARREDGKPDAEGSAPADLVTCATTIPFSFNSIVR